MRRAIAIFAMLAACAAPRGPVAVPASPGDDEPVAVMPRGAWEVPEDEVGASLYRDILLPTVKIRFGGAFSGTGTVIYTDANETWVLTAGHVIPTLPNAGGDGIEIVYFGEGRARTYGATFFARDQRRDIALIRVNVTGRLPFAATLADAAFVDNVATFQWVWAVGCPVGYDPLPTEGHIASTDKQINNYRHWLTTSPIADGNSGGGLYDAQTRRLVGLVVRVTVNDQNRQDPIYHLGVVLPLTEVYGWLDSIGLARLHP